MHGPSTSASKRSRSAQPLPVVRDTSSRTGTSDGVGAVGLPAEGEGLDLDVQVEPAALARGQPQAREIEDVRTLRHGLQHTTAARTSLSSRLSTFPVDVRGSSATNSTSRGTL